MNVYVYIQHQDAHNIGLLCVPSVHHTYDIVSHHWNAWARRNNEKSIASFVFAEHISRTKPS